VEDSLLRCHPPHPPQKMQKVTTKPPGELLFYCQRPLTNPEHGRPVYCTCGFFFAGCHIKVPVVVLFFECVGDRGPLSGTKHSLNPSKARRPRYDVKGLDGKIVPRRATVGLHDSAEELVPRCCVRISCLPRRSLRVQYRLSVPQKSCQRYSQGSMAVMSFKD
jgi:hypothetical protein